MHRFQKIKLWFQCSLCTFSFQITPCSPSQIPKLWEQEKFNKGICSTGVTKKTKKKEQTKFFWQKKLNKTKQNKQEDKRLLSLSYGNVGIVWLSPNPTNQNCGRLWRQPLGLVGLQVHQQPQRCSEFSMSPLLLGDALGSPVRSIALGHFEVTEEVLPHVSYTSQATWRSGVEEKEYVGWIDTLCNSLGRLRFSYLCAFTTKLWEGKLNTQLVI